jgi:hypothetical protein
MRLFLLSHVVKIEVDDVLHDESPRDQQATEWLRLGAAARLAGVSRTTLHYKAVDGEVAYAIVDGQRFFRPDDVAAWARLRRTAAKEEVGSRQQSTHNHEREVAT